MNTLEIEACQEIFLKAIELESKDQKLFISQSCHNNPELEKYVLNLLESHQSSDQYFKNLENSISSSHLNEIEDHLYRGINFGKYQIINVLKQGGMGTIFLARRADGEFEREVVIKMIPIDLNFKQSQNQFAHEKEILASLIHPNIGQLYDSGITDTGQSYFVMELVKGKTLINYCNDNKLDIEQRLSLFNNVLKSIGFAHQHLVIHSDIKPSNIMVNIDGQVKLLDFGIAQLIYKNQVKPEGYSLNYLTPEHKNKQAIITTSDIHQLGQLLFELLTNVAPKKVRNKSFEFPLLSSLIRNNEIIDIDCLMKTLNSKHTTIYRYYQSDLQFIVAKALSVDSNNRYQSVQRFEDDLYHFKHKYCISARKPTLFYKISKYIKRNLLLTSLITSLFVASVLFAIITKNHNKSLSIERDKALTIKNLISEIFSTADPAFNPGKELTATEVLDIGLKRVREKFSQPSDIEADLLQEIAKTYQNLGKYEKAQSILKEVYEIKLILYPNDTISKAQSMLLLGENARLMSNNKDAKQWLVKSLEIFSKEKNPEKHLVSVKSKLGRVQVLLGELDEAEIILKEATQLALNIYGENSFNYAQALNDLNSIYFRQGKFIQVQELLIKTKHIREELFAGKKGPILDKDYATNINNLGLAFYLQGELKEAEKYFRQAIELRNIIYTKAHPDQAQSLNNLGLLLNDAGRPDEALPFLRRSLAVRQSTLKKGHMRIYDAWNNLAMVYHENKSFQKAENIYRDILPKVRDARGEQHLQTLSIMTNRANTLMELNHYKTAHDLFEKSLIIRKELLPKDHIYLSYSYIGLGKAKVKLGEIAIGKELILKALEIRQKNLPADSWLIGEALYAQSYVDSLLGINNINEIQNACDILIKVKGKNSFHTIKCLELLNKSNNQLF